ncbi:MAG: site-specific DNA-methyltransferase [Euryarchaeota archaeon]|nr:site-specific DNA-methyltransferase [Euryarchaeota archaeon]
MSIRYKKVKSHSVRLEWDGKTIIPPQPALPLIRNMEIFPGNSYKKGESAPKNRLIFGDNLPVMDDLLNEMRGSFRLIYSDPPFATGKGFNRRIGRGEDSRKPETWKLGEGYNDSWKSIEQYLSMLYPRLIRMHELLSKDGTLYLHLDWRAVHFAKVLLDEIFGAENFINEIIWVYHGPSPVKSYFNRKHDTILVYGRGKQRTFFPDRIRVPYHPSTHRTFASSPKAGFGKQPDLIRGKIPEDWWYFPVIARLHKERTGFPTQKPEALLERILLASSDEGDLVGDFFCGSGTTLRVADSLARRWVGCDNLLQSISICQRRLALPASHPYAIESFSGSSLGDSKRIRLRLKIHTDKKKAVVTLAGIIPCRPEGFPASLDFWEVDFDYRGDIVRSTGQAARPWRKGSAELSLSHTYPRKGKYRVFVRGICSDGAIASMEKSVHVT